MIINLQKLTALFPFLVLILALVIVMLSISYNRNHFFVATSTVLSLMVSFVSLYFLIKIVPIDINNLFYITRYSILYIGMIIISSFSTCIFSYFWLLNYPFNKEEFYLLILLSTLGAIALSISSNMSSLFISMELMSLPYLGLIAYAHYQKYSLETSFKYLVLSGVTSSFLLLGISWIYAVTGNLSISSINSVFNNLSSTNFLIMFFGTTMILMSFLFKLSLVPFHLWISDIYRRTSSPVLTFFSVSSKISIFSFLLYFFSYPSILNNKKLTLIILLISIFSIFFGNIMALFQKNIKKFFGYSSISQMGYLLIIFLVTKNDYHFSLEAGGIYLLNYLLAGTVYFGTINLISNYYNRNHLCEEIYSIDAYKGLFWSQPLLSSIMIITCLSLAGMPMTLGFWGKFYILSIIIKNHLWPLIFLFFIGTIIGFLGYLKVIINFYLTPLKSFNCINDINMPYNWYYHPSGIIILFFSIIILFLGIYPNLWIFLTK